MKKKLLLVIFLPVLLNSHAYARILKDGEERFTFLDLLQYEKPVKKGDNDKKWYLNLSAGYIKKEGNTDSENSTYSGLIKYDNNHTTLKLNYFGSYGKLDNKVNENKGTATGNFDYFLFWRFKFFFYSMSDYDKITLLTHRNGTGAGAKIYLIRNNYILIDLSGAPIRQYEKYEEQPAKEDWRWSVRGRAQLFPFSEDFSVQYYAFYIPSMKDNNNYRTIQDLYFYKKIAGSLGFKAGYRREFNTYDKKSFEENPLLKKTDSTTYFQVSLTL